MVTHVLDFVVVVIYFIVLILLSIYGIHRYIMVHLFRKYRAHEPRLAGTFEELPKVTVQLPIYNEMYVVERLIDAVCHIDYPREKFEVQVLDDSTDETQKIAKAVVERYQAKGMNIQYMRRADRVGFKAGALAAGFEKAQGEFIAIFDADFIPCPEILMKTIHYFTNPEIGMVQV
ncbi:MAG: glycosyltransferase, partial [Acidobacteriota bacterium]